MLFFFVEFRLVFFHHLFRNRCCWIAAIKSAWEVSRTSSGHFRNRPNSRTTTSPETSRCFEPTFDSLLNSNKIVFFFGIKIDHELNVNEFDLKQVLEFNFLKRKKNVFDIWLYSIWCMFVCDLIKNETQKICI